MSEPTARSSFPATPAPRLDYAPSSQRQRQRRWVRRAVLLLLLLSAAVAAVRTGPPVVRQAAVAWRQRRCLAYTAPPDLVVYESDPAAAESLVAREGYVRGNATDGHAVALYVPRCLRDADPLSLGGGGEAVLFLHGRTTRGGVVKLVTVRCNPIWDPAASMPGYFTKIVATPEPWTRPVPVQQLVRDYADSDIPFHRLSSGSQAYVHLRLFAGQPDPTDEAHFTLAFERDGRRGVIDGWLVDDRGVAVRMQIRGDRAALQQ